MSQAWGEGPFPRPALIGGAVLVGGALLLASVSRLIDPAPTRDTASMLTYRDLRFVDTADGGVSVTDAANGQEVGVVPPGTGGFLRATVRGLASARRREGAGPEQPFRLAARSDGQITLDDPATGRELDLMAFGPTNAAAFARLLPGSVGPVPSLMP